MSESGYCDCPCCGETIMVGDCRSPELCDDCKEHGCEKTRDACGELNYWDCQRPEEEENYSLDDEGEEECDHDDADDLEDVAS